MGTSSKLRYITVWILAFILMLSCFGCGSGALGNTCPYCNASLTFGWTPAGTLMRCPDCTGSFKVSGGPFSYEGKPIPGQYDFERVQTVRRTRAMEKAANQSTSGPVFLYTVPTKK
jgi:hypothetical protein